MILPSVRIKPQIISIFDGDTLLVEHNGNRFSSRARWIDTPELKKSWQQTTDSRMLNHWQWGINAKDFLATLIAGRTLIVIPYEVDIYSRWLCDWYLDSVSPANNVQLILCRTGHSAYYLPFQYYDFLNNRSLSLYTGIIRRCAIAKSQKLGFWQNDNFMLPYEAKRFFNPSSAQSE
jgi:endonuclease YncB( thermonuclease family)